MHQPLRCSIAALRWSMVLTLACLGACGDEESESGAAHNSAPTISGTAPQLARIGVPYSFQPVANDADGDELHFSATGLPVWASINAATGRIGGTPEAGEEGSSAPIRISVSDGAASTALAAFTITVSQSVNGSVVLSWLPPTGNADGSTLSDLAGYRIEFGRTPDALDQSINIHNPSINTYVIEELAPGRWYFAVIARNTGRVESPRSSLGSKMIEG